MMKLSPLFWFGVGLCEWLAHVTGEPIILRLPFDPLVWKGVYGTVGATQ